MARPSRLRRDWLILSGWLASLVLVRAGTVQEGDPYWQIRAGLENLAGQPNPRPDAWSWAPVDGLFYQTSPGWNDALALGWTLGGFWGFFVLSAAAIATYVVLAAVLAQRLGARPLPALAGLIVCWSMAMPMISPRAPMVAQGLLMLAVLAADRWADVAPRRGLVVNAAVPLVTGFTLSAVGNWAHLSWSFLAGGVALAWAVIWWFTQGLGTAQRWVMTLSGTLGLAAGILAGPYGLGVYERAQTVDRQCRGVLLEWSNPFIAEAWLPWGVFALLGVAFALGGLWWWTRATRLGWARDPQVRLLAALCVIGLPAAVAGLTTVRLIGVAMLTLAPVVAAGASVLSARLHRRSVARPHAGIWRSARVREWFSEPPWRVVLSAVILVLAPLTLLQALPHGQPLGTAAAEHLPHGCRLFAPASYAASLLLRPDVTVWIDGRLDYYGPVRLEQSLDYLLSPDPEQPVPPGTTCVVLPAQIYGTHTTLIDVLDGDPRWRHVGTWDDYAVWVPSEPSPSVATDA